MSSALAKPNLTVAKRNRLKSRFFVVEHEERLQCNNYWLHPYSSMIMVINVIKVVLGIVPILHASVTVGQRDHSLVFAIAALQRARGPKPFSRH